jgi:hypothetical protein
MNCAPALVVALLLPAWHAAQAQTDAPPPLRSETAPAASSAAHQGNTPRPAIVLTPAERQAIDQAALNAVKPASVEQALVPSEVDLRVQRQEEPGTRIEQTRNNVQRVTEVTVTPAGSTRSYVMTQREDRQPLSVTRMNSGLSVPMFFRFEFGRTAPVEAPAPIPPAPPSR